MWDDDKQLHAIALTLLAIAVVGVAWAVVAWGARQHAFDFREVVVSQSLERVNAAHLEAVIRAELSGTFFTLNLERARAALRNVPWVRNVALRRTWPHRLDIAVEEQVPLARWNDHALVNREGEVFDAQWRGELPIFEGPEGRSSELAQHFGEWTARLAPLGLLLQTVRLSPRGGWQLRTASRDGPLTIELGHDDPDGRLARFVGAHARSIGPLRRAGTQVDAVDLRYRNGFAVRVPGFREKPQKPAA